MREITAAQGVHLIDLARTVPKDSRNFIDPVHFSNQGAAVVGHLAAQSLAAFLEHGDGV
jgi:hypothetical protein